MSKRLVVYFGVLGAALALGTLGFAKLGASLWSRPEARSLRREVTGGANSAGSPSTGDGWIHFDRTTFVDTQGNFVSAGQIYLAQESEQAVRQPVVIKTHIGIRYKTTVPGWQSILHRGKVITLVVEIHMLRWVDFQWAGLSH